MSEEKIRVAAAVIRRGGRFLLGLRPRAKRHGGRWEFPGGKLDPGETLADALRRELREELALELTSAGGSLFVAQDPGSPFEVHFVAAEASGEPEALEHEEVRWISPAEGEKLDLAPSDRAFFEQYLLPRHLKK